MGKGATFDQCAVIKFFLGLFPLFLFSAPQLSPHFLDTLLITSPLRTHSFQTHHGVRLLLSADLLYHFPRDNRGCCDCLCASHLPEPGPSGRPCHEETPCASGTVVHSCFVVIRLNDIVPPEHALASFQTRMRTPKELVHG